MSCLHCHRISDSGKARRYAIAWAGQRQGCEGSLCDHCIVGYLGHRI
ncbi:MAG: hypothetical protein F6K50_16385 [Moorea sp. SIO3I7]|nr:hypothetical protein [Moorena sp. SIO3I7]